MYVYCVYLCIYKDTHMHVYISDKFYFYIINIYLEQNILI